MRRLIAACFIVVACTNQHVDAPAPARLGLTQLESGPYSVGLSIILEHDATRPAFDTSAGSPAGRPMQIAIWYPARSPGARPVSLRHYVELSAGALGMARNADSARAHTLAEFSRPPLANGVTPQVLDAMIDTPMSAGLGAPAANGRFPLVVFLHTTPWGASAMSEYLASYGFVVAAIESKGEREPAYRLSRENLDAMVRDASFTIARMRREPYVNDRLAVIGMSNGSIAAMALQLNGVVPTAVVSLDGGIGERAGGTYLGERSGSDPTRFTVPLLHLFSPDNPALDFQYLRSYERAQRTLVRVGHLRHGDFLTGGALERLVPGAFGVAPADVTIGFETVCRFTKNFLRWKLTGDTLGANFVASSPEMLGPAGRMLTIERLPARMAAQ